MPRSSGPRSRASIVARSTSSHGRRLAIALVLACGTAACGSDTTDPDPDPGPGWGSLGNLTGLWDATASGIAGLTSSGQIASCTARWVMSIDSVTGIGTEDFVLTQLPYTTTLSCAPGSSGIWLEAGVQLLVRQSGDSFALLTATRGDTFAVIRRPTAATLVGHLHGYQGAAFEAVRHAGTVDPNRAPYTFDLRPVYVDGEVGDSVVIPVQAYDAYYANIPDPAVRWSSSAPDIATVTAAGVVHDVKPGTTTLRATLDTMVRTMTFTVLEPAASLEIVSAPDSLIDPDTVYVQAVARDAQGQVLPNRRFQWSSSDPAIATVLDAGDLGYVLTTGPGIVTITARSNAASASVAIPVFPGVAQISVTGVPPGGQLIVGASVQLSAVPRDAHGNPLTGRPVSWTLDDAPFGALSLTPTGLVTARRTGHATVGAHAGDSTTRVTLFSVMDAGFTALAAGTGHTCGLTTSARIYCWGSATDGRAGPTDETGPGPSLVRSPETFAAVEAGDSHTCALNTAGAAFCWGRDEEGELGAAAGEFGEVLAVTGGHAFTRLTLGYRHTCGLTAAHTVFCWGDNELGELGRGTSGIGANPTPALVTGAHAFADVQAGGQHTCGLTTAGEAWCWGDNTFGELGLGTTDGLPHPTPVHAAPGLTFSALASAWGRSCGITTGGHVTCWGYVVGAPTEVAGLSGIVRITGGGTYGFCGLDAAGIVSCWGHTEPTVQFLPTMPLADITVGTISACALPVTGKAFCWGFNLAYQLGGESDGTVDGPVEIIGQP